MRRLCVGNFCLLLLFGVGAGLVSSALGQTDTAAAVQIVSNHRVIYYYQTQFDKTTGNYISLSPLWANLNPANSKPYTTDIIVAALHLGNQSDGSTAHLNNYPPADSRFATMWQDVATAQSYGINVHLMVGGASSGSFTNLVSDFNTWYPVLKQILQTYKLNGVDLDVEQSMPLSNMEQLINQLHTDFGSTFQITLAPVASALSGGSNLSGFDYKQLYQSTSGPSIAWFNAQFYNGFGDSDSTSAYDSIVSNGFPSNLVVMGVLSDPSRGSGYYDPNTVASNVSALAAKYPTFGGVACWEYFDAQPGGTTDPSQWAKLMSTSMGTGASSITDEAESLPVAGYTSGDTERVALDTPYSGGEGVILEGKKAGDYVAFTVNVPKAGTYDVHVRMKSSYNRGIWQFSVDGTNVGSTVDQYSANPVFPEDDMGKVIFSTAGNHTFTFTLTGKNSASSGWWIALDYIKLIPQ